MKKLIICITTIITTLSISSCGSPRLKNDPTKHCLNHKYSNNETTCSSYHLVKPDKHENNTPKNHIKPIK